MFDKEQAIGTRYLIDYQGKVVSLWWGNVAGMGLTRWMWLASPVEGTLAIPPWRGALSRAQRHASGVIAKKVGPEAGRASCRIRGPCSVDMGIRRTLGDHFTLARHWWGVTTCCPGWDPGPEKETRWDSSQNWYELCALDWWYSWWCGLVAKSCLILLWLHGL